MSNFKNNLVYEGTENLNFTIDYSEFLKGVKKCTKCGWSLIGFASKDCKKYTVVKMNYCHACGVEL